MGDIDAPTNRIKPCTAVDMTGWSDARKALTTLGLAGLARTGGESPASLLAGDHWLFLMFDEIAVKPYTVDTIFVCGGIKDMFNMCDTVEICSISKNGWHDAPNLPEPRCGHGIALVDGRVFVFGGCTPSGYTSNFRTDTCLTFSIPENKWEVIPPMPFPNGSPVVTVVGDRIFVIGSDCYNLVQVYNVSGNTWTAPGIVAPMPTPRYSFEVAVIGTRIFTIGGFEYLTTVEVYDTETNVWTKLSPMPTARMGMAMIAIDHRIWCFGGYNDYHYLDVVEVFDVDKNEWTTTKFRMTSPRIGPTAVVIDGMIWITGGRSVGANTLNLVEIFDPATGSWTNASCMHTPRYGHAAIAF